jgi:UDP:flavonoid glycosyltransferase YjiC (YdhE family)
MRTRSKPVVLLVAEAVTLAHFARIVSLARALDPSRYNIVVAADPRYRALADLNDCTSRSIYSISSTEFAVALARGKPLYSAMALIRYVEDDLALLDEVKPDLVVGDFRLSLAVSAPLRQIPYAAVVNAYWSPYADIAYPVPDLPMTRILGVPLAQNLFNLARPFAFALHARPLNQVRRRYGLPPLGHDLRVAYTWGDYTLYADVPELVPMRPLPAHHRHLGPTLWSACAPLPDWWGSLPQDKPVVLLTLGSSGRADLLPIVLCALAALPITVITATAGKTDLADIPANAYVADFLPLDRAVQRSRLVICNGGSLATYQALQEGVPILGLCANMDQLLNMAAIERLGAGISLRAAQVVRPAQLHQVVHALLESPAYARFAAQAGQRFRKMDASQHFREFVTEVIGKP